MTLIDDILRFSRNRLGNLFQRNISYYVLANVLYSMSSFIVNLSLPFVLDTAFYSHFVYVFQMVMFMTGMTQLGIIVGLYRFIKQNRHEALNVYYTILLFIYLTLLILGCITNNFINQLIKIGQMSTVENLLFYMAIIVSSMYVYNKGKNVADKAYKYMMRVTLSAFIIRVLILVLLFFLHTTSLSLVLFLLFVLPFVQDVVDYIRNSFKHVSFKRLNRELLKTFMLYSLKVWLIGALFTTSDKIFLISTKGLDAQFTTAIAFSAGFIGIISLFNQTFQNYFISNLSPENPQNITRYIRRIKKMSLVYFVCLLFVAIAFSGIVYLFYSRLGMIASIVLFTTLVRAGFISYLGMFSLLTKVLDLLNVEILLGIARIAVVYCLCNLWHPENMLIWYIVVLFSVPFPEFVLSILVCRKTNRITDNI